MERAHREAADRARKEEEARMRLKFRRQERQERASRRRRIRWTNEPRAAHLLQWQTCGDDKNNYSVGTGNIFARELLGPDAAYCPTISVLSYHQLH